MAVLHNWPEGIKAKPKKGSPIVDDGAPAHRRALQGRGRHPWLRRTVRQDLSLPLVDAFFSWLTAHAARVSRKSDLGEAMAYMLRRQDGFRLFLDDGHVDIDSNLVDLFIRLANGHLDKDIGALMPWACSSAAQPEIASIPEK